MVGKISLPEWPNNWAIRIATKDSPCVMCRQVVTEGDQLGEHLSAPAKVCGSRCAIEWEKRNEKNVDSVCVLCNDDRNSLGSKAIRTF